MASGHLAVNGSVAYAAQQAWIFNGTVRDNILFGKPYEQERYIKSNMNGYWFEPLFSNIFNSRCLHQWYLFFSVFRYQNVLFVCGLQPDLLLLANGDETEVTTPPPSPTHTHTLRLK